jgi:5'-3' exonuclease
LKIKLCAIALALPVALMTLTGCSMTDANNSNDIPSSGTSTSSDAAKEAEKASSELYNLIGLKGKASDTGPGVKECGKKDPEKYFQIIHSWSFTPPRHSTSEGTMERLKENLPKHGWEVVNYGPDTSRNKNLSLRADDDTKKFSVDITYRAKDNTPHLNFFVISGCYQIPDGKKIEQF